MTPREALEIISEGRHPDGHRGAVLVARAALASSAAIDRDERLNGARQDSFDRGYRAAVRDVDRGFGPGQERLEQARAALASEVIP